MPELMMVVGTVDAEVIESTSMHDEEDITGTMFVVADVVSANTALPAKQRSARSQYRSLTVLQHILADTGNRGNA